VPGSGIAYGQAEWNRSALYLALLPLVNAERVVFLDVLELLRELPGGWSAAAAAAGVTGWTTREGDTTIWRMRRPVRSYGSRRRRPGRAPEASS